MSCPLCNFDKATVERRSEPNLSFVFQFTCSRCGEFTINENTLERLLYNPDLCHFNTQRHLISGYIRELKEAQKTRSIFLNLENIEVIINQGPTKVAEKIERMLMNLSNMSPFPGKKILIIDDFDYPLGYCCNEAEFAYFRKYLEESQLLEPCGSDTYKLSVKAWDRIEALQRNSSSTNQVFIAMNFDKEFGACYTSGIKRALDETGYKPYRIDYEEHVDRIDDKILSEIKRSKFIVAEFTGQKHGVYFEAGYALGLGIPVIWICHEVDKDSLHFDTRQYNHILWDDKDDLKEKLVNRIRVLIGANK